MPGTSGGEGGATRAGSGGVGNEATGGAHGERDGSGDASPSGWSGVEAGGSVMFLGGSGRGRDMVDGVKHEANRFTASGRAMKLP